VLCYRDPVDRWIDGRVTLLGDAAHPALQYLAQGAGMAMEDSVCLADAVAADPGAIETAFESYRQKRVLRTARVQLMSRFIGEHVYHPAATHAALRNWIIRAKSNDWYDALAWLYAGPDESGAASTVAKKTNVAAGVQP
jgi:2-polyprenyl-6-methoxyphenol hydroxylase-like FAD-dependent oxidoreductase